MSRILATTCLVLILLAGSAWADDAPPSDAPPNGPSTPEMLPPGGGAVAPPVTTMLPEQGGTLLGRELEDQLTIDDVTRAVPGDAFRSWQSPWQGSVRLRNRFRHTTESGQQNDNDLYAFLRLKYRDEMDPGWSASLHGRATLDTDYFGDTDGFYAYDSITDTYSSRLNGRLYHLYANYRWARGVLEQIRFGRLYVDIGEYMLLDGAQVWSRPFGRGYWQFSLFGGVPAYLFTSSPEGDWTAGAQVTGRPWKGADLRVSYAHVQNDQIYGLLRNNFADVTINQRFGLSTLARLTYQQLDDDPRMVRLTVDSVLPAPDLTIRGYFQTVPTVQEERVYDFDYYYWSTLELAPYGMLNLSLAKGIGEFFSVEGGISGRWLYSAQDEGTYNREFEQYFITLASYDWLVDNLDMSISGEWWDSDDDIWTVTFDVDWKPSRCFRLSFGTDYAAYRYDLYADVERQNVFGGFIRASWRPSDRWRLDARLRMDNDLYGTWTQFDVGLQYDF